MRPSIIRHADLPESPADYATLAARPHGLRFTTCFDCKQPFTEANVRTALGWAETQISGSCEACFDKLFAEESDVQGEEPKA